MKNAIYITGLEVFAYHGVFAEEKSLGQKFIFDISCDLDYRQAMLNDDLESSVSYGDIAELVYKVATEKKYNLLEKLSFEICKAIFTDYILINKIKIKINKPNAPVQKIFSECGTVLKITRAEFEDLLK